MDLTRRHLVAAAAMAPLGIAAAALAVRAGAAVDAAASSLRPEARGTSATACAFCGAPDHTMLDGCPAARSVRVGGPADEGARARRDAGRGGRA